MINKKKYRNKPLYKKFNRFKKNIQNRQKLLKFKKQKWNSLLKQIRLTNKFSKPEPTKYLVNRSSGGLLESFVMPLISCASPESYLGETAQTIIAVAPVVVAPYYPFGLTVFSYVTVTMVGVAGIRAGYNLTCRCWTGVSKLNESEAQPESSPYDLSNVQFREIPAEGPVGDLAETIGEAVMTDLHGVAPSEVNEMSHIDSIASAITQDGNGNISFHLKIKFIEFVPEMLNLPALSILEHPYVTNLFSIFDVPKYQLAFLETLGTDNTHNSVLTVFCVLLPKIVAILNNYYEVLQLGESHRVSRNSQLGFLYLIMEDERLAQMMYIFRTYNNMSLEVLTNFFQTTFVEPVNPYEIPEPED